MLAVSVAASHCADDDAGLRRRRGVFPTYRAELDVMLAATVARELLDCAAAPRRAEPPPSRA